MSSETDACTGKQQRRKNGHTRLKKCVRQNPIEFGDGVGKYKDGAEMKESGRCPSPEFGI